jgi:hypothetical protein
VDGAAITLGAGASCLDLKKTLSTPPEAPFYLWDKRAGLIHKN